MNTILFIAVVLQLYKLLYHPAVHHKDLPCETRGTFTSKLPDSIPFPSIQQRYKNCFLNISVTPKLHNHTFLALIFSLISGDIQPNPGPTIYPCGFCELPVSWSTPGVECEACDIWFHKSCIEMCTRDYDNLANVSWLCCRCHSINHSSTTFHSYELITSNYYEPLRGNSDCSILSSIGSPDPVLFPEHVAAQMVSLSRGQGSVQV